MRIAVHHVESAGSEMWSWRWIDELKKRNVEVLVVDLRQQDAISSLKGVDGVMWHWDHAAINERIPAPSILRAIEHGLRIPVFPNWNSSWHFNQKVSQHYLLEAMDAPRVKSWVFWDYAEACEFLRTCEYPIVFKLSSGAGGANVMKLDSERHAARIVRRMFTTGIKPYTLNEFSYHIPKSRRDLSAMKSRVIRDFRRSLHLTSPGSAIYDLPEMGYVYLQEFVPGNDYDIRTFCIGRRLLGAIRYNRPGDFRASGAGLIVWDPELIPKEALRTSCCIAHAAGFQSVAFDFLRAPDGKYLLTEMSYCYPSYGVHNCPGHWDEDLNWHEGQIWPEEAIVEDFLREIEAGHR